MNKVKIEVNQFKDWLKKQKMTYAFENAKQESKSLSADSDGNFIVFYNHERAYFGKSADEAVDVYNKINVIQ